VSDARLVALVALVATALAFLAGVRLAFRRPGGGHRYRASRVSGAILALEAAAITLAPVPPGRALAAVAMLGAASALFLWAAWTNRTRKLALAFSGAAPEHVQTAGPYRLVRHPFYTSYLLAFLGGAVAAGTPWILPAVLAGAVTYWRAARGEEQAFARSDLAGAYRRYAARVGMFVPRLFRTAYGSSEGTATSASARSPEGNAG
jgi:protein-S-isoprenylcysteine O-methyltransferase Ste14